MAIDQPYVYRPGVHKYIDVYNSSNIFNTPCRRDPPEKNVNLSASDWVDNQYTSQYCVYMYILYLFTYLSTYIFQHKTHTLKQTYDILIDAQICMCSYIYTPILSHQSPYHQPRSRATSKPGTLITGSFLAPAVSHGAKGFVRAS